jgi:hypothetical protein
MNKYMTLIVMVLFLVLVTVVADSALGISANLNIVDGINVPPPETWLGRFSVVTDMIKVFFNIMLFQVEGLPAFFNIVVFYPLSFGIVYMIIDIFA